MGKQRIVIITGMHRSGTSLTASILERAGVHVGSRLVPADEGNPRGYFEDVEFHAFHEALLARFGQTWLVQDTGALGEVDPQDVRKAKALVEARRGIELWGWKDPRTCLFLDFWHELLPDARFVFIYRHPLEVVLSLLRRSQRVDVEALSYPIASFRSWSVHNDLLLDFYKRNASISFLAHVYAVAAEPKRFVQAVSGKLGLNLRTEEAGGVYAEDGLERTEFPDGVAQTLKHLLPKTVSLYDELESIADLPRGERPSQSPALEHFEDSVRRGTIDRPQDEDGLSREVSRALMTLAPETFLASRESLDDMRLATIGELRARLEAVEEEAREMRSVLKEHLVLEQKLAAIEASRAWRAARKWYSLKTRLSQARQRTRVRRFLAGDEAGVDRMGLPPRRKEASTPGKAVLFICHDARPHGAQFLLLHLLRWLAKHTSIRFEVLLKEGGPLKEQFEALAPVSIWHDEVTGELTSPQEPEDIARVARLLAGAEIGLIYSNTLANGEFLYLLSKSGVPVLCHVHELSYFMTYGLAPFLRRQMRRHVDRFIAASRAVRDSLIQTMEVPAERISVVHEFIPTEVQFDISPAKIKRSLSIPETARVVGGSGTTDWRKGPDLFVQLALAVRKRCPSEAVHFVWIGGANEGPIFGALWHDVLHAGMADRVHFLGHRENPTSYVAAFDVFALTSREDPYPLVCLEAAACSKPIVCFEGSGGAPEFVEEDCGFVVPYLDVEAMAGRVLELLTSSELRTRLGQRARDKVRERHDVSVAAPKIAEIIEGLLDRKADLRDRDLEASAR